MLSAERFMQEALKEAEKGFCAGEVPVGAVLVHNGEVIARAHNLVESLQDASAHAELLCLRQGAARLGNWRLAGAALYTTLEPCAMCLGAMLLFRLPELVWAAPDVRHGALGSWVNLLRTPHPTHCLSVRSGVRREESAALLKRFFLERREWKRCSTS